MTAELYEAMRAYATWAALPPALTRPGARGQAKEAVPRFVHAKLYRLWQDAGKQAVLVGSVNLTRAAHSQVGAGNLEASFLVDVSDDGIPTRWWLEPIEHAPNTYAETDPEAADASVAAYVDISFRFDWLTSTLWYRVEGEPSEPLSVQDPSDRDLFGLAPVVSEQWVDCGQEAAESVRELLISTSFLQIVHPRGSWRVLVCEEGLSQRPSLLMTLTPEEILMYWSLLSEAQKEAFLTAKLAGEAQLQGLATSSCQGVTGDTIFDCFAGIYHAFEQLYRHVMACLDRGEARHAATRLFGAKYDALPELLRKTLAQNEDPVMRYLIFLCARQLCDRIRTRDDRLWHQHPQPAQELKTLLNHIPALADALPLEGDHRDAFINLVRAHVHQLYETTGGGRVHLKTVTVDFAQQLIDFASTERAKAMGFAEAQLHGAVAIYNMLARNRVGYIADEVGMGKTYVALGTMGLFAINSLKPASLSWHREKTFSSNGSKNFATSSVTTGAWRTTGLKT